MPCATAYPAPTESWAVSSALAGSLLPAVASVRWLPYEVASSEPRIAMPSEPPSSSEVSLTAPPTPSSDSGKAPMIASVQGERARPMARPRMTRGATKSPYVEPASTRVSRASAVVPPTMPAVTVSFMPTRGVSQPVRAEPTKTAPASGSIRTPVSRAS